MMNDNEIFKKELETSLFHEYGHYAVCESCGANCWVEIEYNENYNPDKFGGDRMVYGTCKAYINNLSDEQKLRVGLAGEVCEYLSKLKDIQSFNSNNLDDIFKLHEYLEETNFSDTDHALLGEWWFEDLQPVIDVVNLLKKEWNNINSKVQFEMHWRLSE